MIADLPALNATVLMSEEAPPEPAPTQRPRRGKRVTILTPVHNGTTGVAAALPGSLQGTSPNPELPYVTVPLLAAEHQMTQSSSGVTLWQDRKDEAYYLEVAPEHDPLVLRRFLLLVDAIGLEVMDDDECPPEVLRDGSVRHWLAEKVREVIL